MNCCKTFEISIAEAAGCLDWDQLEWGETYEIDTFLGGTASGGPASGLSNTAFAIVNSGATNNAYGSVQLQSVYVMTSGQFCRYNLNVTIASLSSTLENKSIDLGVYNYIPNYTGGVGLATISHTGIGAGLTVTPTVSFGVVTSVAVSSGGTGYVTGDYIGIVDATGQGFVGVVTAAAGVVSAVAIANIGSVDSYVLDILAMGVGSHDFEFVLPTTPLEFSVILFVEAYKAIAGSQEFADVTITLTTI